MKKDIEHLVASTAMFVIAFVASSRYEPATVAPRQRRLLGARGLIWSIGMALLLAALVWTVDVYLGHLAFCAHLRLRAATLPMLRPGTFPRSLEYVDLSALGIEAVLLSALFFLGIHSFRQRRSARRHPARVPTRRRPRRDA